VECYTPCNETYGFTTLLPTTIQTTELITTETTAATTQATTAGEVLTTVLTTTVEVLVETTAGPELTTAQSEHSEYNGVSEAVHPSTTLPATTTSGGTKRYCTQLSFSLISALCLFESVAVRFLLLS